MWISALNGKVMPFYEIINICYNVPYHLTFKDVSFIICSLKLVDDKISKVTDKIEILPL